MKKIYWMGFFLGMAFVAAAVMATRDPLLADDDETENGSEATASFSGPDNATQALYVRECGSCHLAYPPELLPAASWKRVMGGLADHFGDNAELSADDHQPIADYLTAHAADRSGWKRSAKILRSLEGREPPIRITEVPYIERKHDEIPARFVSQNPKVKSLSHCNACHTRADRGSFDEDGVSIPGYGRWDD